MTVRTYGNYLKLDELLALQQPLSDGPEHDEMLFIVIHQVYELWFKQLLHEHDLLQQKLAAGATAPVMAAFKRVRSILKTLVAQVDILETMTPSSFSSFRDRLDAASGFQSVQFRELEVVLGVRRPGMIRHIPTDDPAHRRLLAKMSAPSLYDSFLRFLAKRGRAVPEELLERDYSQPVPEDERVRALLVKIYRGQGDGADDGAGDLEAREVCELMVDIDEGLQEWRYRHFKMVQRTIGDKPGTGGSPGAAYLATTLSRPLFPDLWTIRSEL